MLVFAALGVRDLLEGELVLGIALLRLVVL